METRLEPGEETLPHSHPIDAAVVFLTSGRMLIQNDDGTSDESTLQRGSVAFGRSPVVHRAGIGQETVRVATVELFSQPPPGPMTSLPSSSEVMLENDRVLLSRIRLDPGEELVVPSASWLVVVPQSNGTVTTGGRATAVDGGGTLWHEAGDLELQSDDRVGFEAVIVMLKPRG